MAGDFGPAWPAGGAPPDLKEWEEYVMATKRPSFLKRQKEMKRTAKAAEKREARRGRKDARGSEPFDPMAPDPSIQELEPDQDQGQEPQV